MSEYLVMNRIGILEKDSESLSCPVFKVSFGTELYLSCVNVSTFRMVDMGSFSLAMH